jgi:hypothetical protein
MRFFHIPIFALYLIGAHATAAEQLSEPTACYRLAATMSEKLGWDLRVGSVVTLCSGATDAKKVVACYAEAFAHSKDGGLGLTAGQAVMLCKTNSLPAS